MKTSKPISTISYNSEEYLKSKLDYLVKNNTVEFWFYVKHLGEYDKETNMQDTVKLCILIYSSVIE